MIVIAIFCADFTGQFLNLFLQDYLWGNHAADTGWALNHQILGCQFKGIFVWALREPRLLLGSV
jgi:hypothetical protein